MTVTTPTDIINNNFRKAKVEIEALKDKNARNIGELVYSSIPLSDAGLHLLDGSLIQGTGMYAGFVTYIASLYNATGNPYAACFVTESQWQTTLSTYGVCGKFVYNSTNNTVRLPKITGVIEGTVTAAQVGNIVEASLPSTITSSNYLMVKSSDNTTIEDPDEVQPQTTKLLVYMVVANSTKTEIEVDIDNVASDLNTLSGNVNTLSSEVSTLSSNVDNIVSDNSSDIVALIAPSIEHVMLTLGESNSSYTCPATGWLCLYIYFNSTGQSWVRMKGTTTDFRLLPSSGSIYINKFVKKGEKITISYTGSIQNSDLRFRYAEGTKHEKT